MLIVLFGNPGVGKSYIAKLLQQQYGYFFYDADTDLTPAAIDAIQHQHIFSTEVESEFVEVVIDRIKALQQRYPRVVVAQAFGREKARQKLLAAFKEAQFYFIEVPNELANRRLLSRQDWVDISYADKIRQAFEPPLIPHQRIDNSQDSQHVLQQFAHFLDK